MADFKLLLEKSNTQIDTELGVIDMNQIENSTTFSIEIFPPNQNEESFENAEFNNIIDISGEDGLNPDFFHLSHHPKNWTWEQTCDMEQNAIQGIYELVKTVKNISDLKDMKSVGVLYVLVKDVCSFCGKQLTDDNKHEYGKDNYCCDSCFQQMKENRITINDMISPANFRVERGVVDIEKIKEQGYDDMYVDLYDLEGQENKPCFYLIDSVNLDLIRGVYLGDIITPQIVLDITDNLNVFMEDLYFNDAIDDFALEEDRAKLYKGNYTDLIKYFETHETNMSEYELNILRIIDTPSKNAHLISQEL